MKNHDMPESWAHDHSLRSYGRRDIKQGDACHLICWSKVPIEQWVTEIVQRNDPGHQDQRKSTVDLDGSFRGIEHRDI
jgi:hypothetical protein